MNQIKKIKSAHSHNGNGKTHYFMKESDIQQAKNMSYLYSLEAKSISALCSTAKNYFILKNDVNDDLKSEDKIFNILTKNSNNKMKVLHEVQESIRIERFKRKKAEFKIKELEVKRKQAENKIKELERIIKKEIS